MFFMFFLTIFFTFMFLFMFISFVIFTFFLNFLGYFNFLNRTNNLHTIIRVTLQINILNFPKLALTIRWTILTRSIRLTLTFWTITHIITWIITPILILFIATDYILYDFFGNYLCFFCLVYYYFSSCWFSLLFQSIATDVVLWLCWFFILLSSDVYDLDWHWSFDSYMKIFVELLKL